jgi:hypothetical protein
MREIFLSDEQSSVARAASGPVRVCDGAGNVLGHLVPGEEPGGARAVRLDPDDWVRCWNERYFSSADDQ